MTYQTVLPGVFLERPNRFVARVEIDGQRETVHVKNTGRCRELLIPGCRVYLSAADCDRQNGAPARKTAYDLIAVEKERPDGSPLLINLDSQIPNDAAEEWLRSGALFPQDARIRREVRYGDSRFDFAVEYGTRKAFVEVKGVTLEQDGLALFPDAPTERGVKHLTELSACLREGYEAYVLFVIAMKGVRAFSPNDATHPAFGEALRKARQAGVTVLAQDCVVTPSSITLDKPVPVVL